MYFQKFEGKNLCEGILNVLNKHGGRYITADFAYSDLYVGVHIGLLGQEEGMKALIKMAEKTKQKSDSNFSVSMVHKDDSPEAHQLFEECGLKIDRIPFYIEAEKFNIFSQLDSAMVAVTKAVLSKYQAWSVTPASAGPVVKHEEHVKFRAEYETTGNVLKLKFFGRVDSITSTDLMQVWEEAKDKAPFTENLQYISLAGLRVLMIMKKIVGEGEVRCLHTSENVKEIFETTGFLSIFNLIS